MHCNLAVAGVGYLMKLYPVILGGTHRGSIDQVAGRENGDVSPLSWTAEGGYSFSNSLTAVWIHKASGCALIRKHIAATLEKKYHVSAQYHVIT